MYAKITNGAVAKYPYSIADLRADHPDTSFPESIGSADLGGFDVVTVVPTDRPSFDRLQSSIEESQPEFSGGAWRQKWVVSALPAEQVQANLAAAEASRIAALWQAAHNYEFAQISGSAIGLLALGVIAGKPKCLAVQNWIKSIWTLYYARKADGSTSTDFSSCGQIPHTVPDLMVELGV